MSILSINFLLFIILLLLVYYLVPQNKRWIVLLLGSLGFYGAFGLKYLGLIVFTAIDTFFTGNRLNKINQDIKELKNEIQDKEQRKIKKAELTGLKKRWACAAILINFGILFFFKSAYLIGFSSLILPLGISFYTFQSIGYVIDVYRGDAKSQDNFLKYLLFVSYFPQIIQGPVNRYDKLGDQLYEGTCFNIRNLKMGFWLFLWGLFKKLVIAERISVFVNTVLGSDLSKTPGSMILLGVFAFNIRLYTDFSGGIDMVQGISTMFGIEMAENFKRPFFAESLGEYWRRWHISLGAWIRDYLFYPIAMSKTFGKMSRNLEKKVNAHFARTLPGAITSVITFVAIGLWHDISFQYLLYGLWHGIIMGGSQMVMPALKLMVEKLGINTECRSYHWFLRLRTWMLISIGEYFSLAKSFEALLQMFKSTLLNFNFSEVILNIFEYSLDPKDWNVIICSLIVLICVSIKQEEGLVIREALERQNLVFRWMFITTAIMVILIFGVYGTGYNASAFIYGGF